MSCGGKQKFFPNSLKKILPAGLLVAMAFSVSGCHTSAIPVEASTTRVPVVAPAGTVLRVRLSEALDSGRSRPGDRFTGTLDSPVMAGTTEVLAKGTLVEGRVLGARTAGRDGNDAWLVVTLDSYEREGHHFALATSTVARIGRPHSSLRTENSEWDVARISLPADSIIGFTLTSTLAA
jgi:hypothetical protein